LLKKLRKPQRIYYLRPYICQNINQRCEFFWRHYYADDTEFKEFCGFSQAQFLALHDKLIPDLEKKATHLHPINSLERLAIFLRYENKLYSNIKITIFRFLSTALSLRKLAQEFLIGRQTVKQIVDEISVTIIKKMSAEQLPRPSRQTWTDNADKFLTSFRFPNAVAALDGKHFACMVKIYIIFLTTKPTYLVSKQKRVSVLQLQRFLFDRPSCACGL
jgi:hypothetical protein